MMTGLKRGAVGKKTGKSVSRPWSGARLAGTCLALLWFCAPCPALAEEAARHYAFNARQAFLRLPATILENLGEGLSDQGKYELLTRGSSGNWLIRSSTPDLLELESLSDPDSRVMLCLYHGESSQAVAVGTDFGLFCLTELWRLYDKRGAAPMDMPREPHISEFFSRDRSIPADLSVSMTFCARPEGLEVKPQFWSPTGRARLRPDNAVFFIWTGKRFSKRIVPLYRK